MMKKTVFSLLLLFGSLFVSAQNDRQGKSVIPEFELVDMDGNVISSETTRGKVVVMNFWYIGCKPCLKEMPELNSVYEKFAKHPDVVFVSITFDQLERVRKRLGKYIIRYPIVVDGNEACQSFGVQGYPTNIVIDQNGNESFRFTGGFPGIGERISNAVQKALKS